MPHPTVLPEDYASVSVASADADIHDGGKSATHQQGDQKRLRALVIADACSPRLASVPLLGYFHADALRRAADVLVATHIRNRNALTEAGWQEGKDFICIDTERLSWWAWKISLFLRGGEGAGWTTFVAATTPLYYLFESKLWDALGARIVAGEFDVVHRLVPLTPVTPSLMAARCRRHGVPFVLGPLNGGLPWPRGFDGVRRKEREWLSYVRPLHKLLPAYRSTRTCASAIIAGSQYTMSQLPRSCQGKSFYIPENGIEPGRFSGATRDSKAMAGPLRVIFIGRLVPYKGADMLIEAAADSLRAGRVTLEIVGDGPHRSELEPLVKRLGLSDCVTFAGWLEHRKIGAALQRSDVLALPSVREFGGAVVIEAMAAGVVPVVINYGGPAELVTSRTGFVVDAGTREQIIERFSEILRRLCDDRQLVAARIAPARRRALRQFSWDAKARQIVQVWRWVLAPGKPRPVFPIPGQDEEG